MNRTTIRFGYTLFPAEVRAYIVMPLSHAAGRAWRSETMSYLQSFLGIVQAKNVGGLVGALSLGEPIAMDDAAWLLILARAGERLITHVGGFPDWVWERVRAYSPEIAADAEWIEHHATDAEIAEAFRTLLVQQVLNASEVQALAVIAKAMQHTPATAIQAA